MLVNTGLTLIATSYGLILLFSFELCELKDRFWQNWRALKNLLFSFELCTVLWQQVRHKAQQYRLAIFFWIMLAECCAGIEAMECTYACYFLLNYAYIVDAIDSGEMLPVTCYFLLNYALTSNNLADSGNRWHSLLFSFELCSTLERLVLGVLGSCGLLFSFELCILYWRLLTMCCISLLAIFFWIMR